MNQLFISYSRKDETFVRRLAADLSQLGAGVWLDVDDIPAGMKWSTAIQQGLKNCGLMLVIISPDSMASTNVEDEWQSYMDEKKPIIPVLLRPTEVHFQLRRIQYVDFHTQPYETALKALAAEIRRQGISLDPQDSPPAASIPASAPPAPNRVAAPAAVPAAKLPRLSRRWQLAIAAALVGVGLLITALILLSGGGDEKKDSDHLPPPIRTLAPGESPRLEVVDGEGATLRIEDQSKTVYHDMTLNEGAFLASQKSTLRAVFQQNAYAIIQPITLLTFASILDTTAPLELRLDDGEILVEKGDWGSAVAIVYTGDVRSVASGSILRVSYDQATYLARASCFTGHCTVTDAAGVEADINLVGGQQVTVHTVQRDFASAVISDIPPEEYEQYDRLCGGCGLSYPEPRANTPPSPLAFISDQTGFYLLPMDGTMRRLTTSTGSDLSWSPDGQTLLYTATRDLGSSVVKEIYGMDADGGNARSLTPQTNLSESCTSTTTNGTPVQKCEVTGAINSEAPVWSPDGSQIAYLSSQNSTDGTYNVFVLDVRSSQRRPLTGSEDWKWLVGWMPDNQQIVFVTMQGTHNLIQAVNSASGEISTRYETDTPLLLPAVSPDGEQIAFILQHTDGSSTTFELTVIDADGSNQRSLASNALGSTTPAWSPDGQWIAYEGYYEGQSEMAVISAGGGEPRRLTNDEADNFSPRWSPDSQWLAWLSSEDGICISRFDGSAQDCLEETAGAVSIAWMPTTAG